MRVPIVAQEYSQKPSISLKLKRYHQGTWDDKVEELEVGDLKDSERICLHLGLVSQARLSYSVRQGTTAGTLLRRVRRVN